MYNIKVIIDNREEFFLGNFIIKELKELIKERFKIEREFYLVNEIMVIDKHFEDYKLDTLFKNVKNIIFTIQNKIEEKKWGYEIFIVNNNKYCGKILHFNALKKGSLHYHLKKTETWYIQSGKFNLKLIDTSSGTEYFKELRKGDIITHTPGQPHQVFCLEEGDIFEISTQHFDDDSYRITPSGEI